MASTAPLRGSMATTAPSLAVERPGGDLLEGTSKVSWTVLLERLGEIRSPIDRAGWAWVTS